MESRPEGYRQYRSSESMFSLSFPKEWDVTYHDETSRMMQIEGSSENGNTCQLFLSKPSFPRADQFRQFKARFKDNFGSEFQNGRWVDEERLTLNGYATWRMGFVGETQRLKIKTRIHLYHAEDRIYVFQCMGTDPAFSQETETYRIIAGSFRSPPE